MKRSLIRGAVAAMAVALALTGCTGGTTAPGESETPSGPSVDPARVSPTDLPTPPVIQDPKGAITDLTTGDCHTEPGEQKVDGKLTSSQKTTADFLVTISWATATGDVMGRGFKLVKNLAPGQTKEFTIKAKVAEGATQCVKGVEFGSVAD